MSPDLLDALAAVALAVFHDIHRAHPELLAATRPEQISDEAIVAWWLLLCVEELLPAIKQVRDPPSFDPLPEEDPRAPMLPF